LSSGLARVAQISVFAFVLLSMIGAGLGLSLQRVRGAFLSVRTLLAPLVASFVLVPLVAYLITRVVSLDASLAIALLLLGTAAGAPILPKLVEFARGDMGLAVATMAVLMAGTIITMPFLLPLLLPQTHVHVHAWSIARPLLLVVLPSLAVGLALRHYREPLAQRLQPLFRGASNVALAAVIVCAIATNVVNGTGAGLAKTAGVGIVFVLLTFLAGLALGGPGGDARMVSAFGTSQRSASIAFLVATENFHDTNIVSALAIISMIAFVTEVPAALAIGARRQRRRQR
jgi:bile acid:Na+ symporter, BASS family